MKKSKYVQGYTVKKSGDEYTSKSSKTGKTFHTKGKAHTIKVQKMRAMKYAQSHNKK